MTESSPNRVRVSSSTTGTGTSVALGAAVSGAYLTPAEAGMVDGKKYNYVIEQGDDFEVQVGQTYTASGTTIARGTPAVSKISGTAGTTKLTLSGAQQVLFPALKESFDDIYSTSHQWTKPQSTSESALSSGSGADFTSVPMWTANVNGSTFTIANPSVDAAHRTVIFIEVTFTTANSLAFGTKFKVTGYTASTSGKDVLVFMRDGNANTYNLVGYRNGVNT